MAKPVLEYIGAIFCEEIRREDNGKLIFIGVYPEDILPSSYPITLRLSFWVMAKLRGVKSESEFQILVKTNDGGKEMKHKIGNLNAGLQEGKVGNVVDLNFATTPFLINLESDSEVFLMARENGGRWKKIASKLVSRKKKPSSIEQ